MLFFCVFEYIFYIYFYVYMWSYTSLWEQNKIYRWNEIKSTPSFHISMYSICWFWFVYWILSFFLGKSSKKEVLGKYEKIRNIHYNATFLWNNFFCGNVYTDIFVLLFFLIFVWLCCEGDVDFIFCVLYFVLVLYKYLMCT